MFLCVHRCVEDVGQGQREGGAGNVGPRLSPDPSTSILYHLSGTVVRPKYIRHTTRQMTALFWLGNPEKKSLDFLFKMSLQCSDIKWKCKSVDNLNNRTTTITFLYRRDGWRCDY